MNPQLIADLEAARALIETPQKWCRHVMHGECSGIESHCTIGAVDAATGRQFNSRHYAAIAALRDAAGIMSISKWNDAPERTHAEVLELFDKAIANERSKA